MTARDLNDHTAFQTHPCYWMQAKVVRKKYCRKDFECVSCGFDRAMRRVAAENQRLRQEGRPPHGIRGAITFWKDKLNELPQWKRPCIHHMKGNIGFRACTQEYHCSNCEFDQYFQDHYLVHTMVKAVDVLDIEGFKVPQGFYLHPGHTWVKLEEGSTVRVGVDDFALRVLGPMDTFEAPLMGKQVKQDRSDILMKRGTHSARLLSPVSGVVTDVNPKLREEGCTANRSPYSDGWIVRIHSQSLRQDLKKLMIGGETQTFLQKELEQLYQVIEETAGPLAADGGQIGEDIYGKLPDIGWEKLTNLFLHT